MKPASTKRLFIAWLIMAALTLAAIFIGHAGTQEPLGAVLLFALLLLTFVKSAVLLNDYLDLRHAPRWNGAMRSFIGLLLAGLGGLSLIASLV